MNYVILGFGARGKLYAELMAKQKNTKLVAVCEKREDRLKSAGNLYNLPSDKMFLNESDFAAAGKLGELCIISTQDHQHIEHAMMALEVGYDLLLEKPIATKWEDCNAIFKKASKLGRKIFVCYVLRYAPFFNQIKKELDTGAYGKVALINLIENVGYWHQAHSFVRGNWRSSKQAAPMIIAKSSHDCDMISWLAGVKCKSVSSVGSLGYFKEINAPKNSSLKCFDCPIKDHCDYNAEDFYINKCLKIGKTGWPVDVLCQNPTEEKVLEALKHGPYGRCVWKCDNDVVDRQIVNMDFEEGIIANLTMTAFSKESYREIHVHCEKGEIYGNTLDNILTCKVYSQESKQIDANSVDYGDYGHGGGDGFLIEDIVSIYSDKNNYSLTSIENSMHSHAIGFAAEESRLNNGKVIDVYKLIDR